MFLWDQLVDWLRLMIFAYSQACGGNLGCGVLAASLTVRLLLFPLTLRLARSMQAHQRALQKLQPELSRIRERFQKQPERIAAESQKLFEKHKVSPLPVGGCLGAIVQMPIFLAVYSAVRGVVAGGGKFLWIKNIAKPDVWLTLIVAGITALSVAISTNPTTSPSEGKQLLLVLPVIMTLIVLSKVSAGLGLYWGVSASVSLAQSYLVRQTAQRESR